MQYATKSCPHCGKVYARFEPKGKHYRSPLLQCEKCREFFFDRDYTELACEEAPGKPTAGGAVSALFQSLFGLLILVGSLYILFYSPGSTAGDDWVLWVLPFFGGLLLFFGIRYLVYSVKYKDADIFDDPVYQESFKRMSDPGYAWLLHRHGFHVPDRFLLTPEQVNLLKSRMKNADNP